MYIYTKKESGGRECTLFWLEWAETERSQEGLQDPCPELVREKLRRDKNGVRAPWTEISCWWERERDSKRWWSIAHANEWEKSIARGGWGRAFWENWNVGPGQLYYTHPAPTFSLYNVFFFSHLMNTSMVVAFCGEIWKARDQKSEIINTGSTVIWYSESLYIHRFL